MRVHELAKQLSMKSRELLDACERLGIKVKSHASSLDEEAVERLKEDLVESGESVEKANAEVVDSSEPVERPKAEVADSSEPVEQPKADVAEPDKPAKEVAPRGNEALPEVDEDDIEEDADGNRDVPIPAKRKGGGQPRRSTPRQFGGLAENDPFFQFGSLPETWGSTRKKQDQPRHSRPKAYLECTNCGVKIEKKRAHGGKKVRCPFCPRWMREVK
jgi:hypothetical protein